MKNGLVPAIVFGGCALGTAILAFSAFVQPAQAQQPGAPFEVGQRVTLSYGERTVHCTIEEIRGAFLRCAVPKPDPFTRFPAGVNWHNTATTESITVRPE